MEDNQLFNWGGRGPEWEAIQRKLEMDAALMEQAMRIRLSQAGQVGQAGGVGGGSKKLDASSNGYAEDGYIDNYFV